MSRELFWDKKKPVPNNFVYSHLMPVDIQTLIHRRFHRKSEKSDEARNSFSHPIVQGPTAGGCNTPVQVAAVSNAGALGSWPVPY
jgi:hypothetical protein